MSKQNRLKEAKLYHIARNEVLKSNDPERWIYRDGMEVSLGILMSDIHDYIEASLVMGNNPLQYLRRHFPDFVWKFHEDKSELDAVNILAGADYIWLRCFGSLIDEFITATQVDRKSRRTLCYRPRKEDNKSWTAVMKLRVPTIRFVVNGDEFDANTIID